MEKQHKKISVIIPVYNAENYIRETLDSIIKQSYTDWEIILIENGSDDGSPDIIKEYEAAYPEIHVISEQKKGPAPARNSGMKLAKGEYIVFVDADDYLPDTEIFRKYINIAEQMDVDIIVSNYVRLWNGRTLPAVRTDSFSLSGPASEWFRFQGFFAAGTLSYVWGKLYKKEFLEKNQITFEEISYAEDKLFNMQCYVCGARYLFIDSTGYVYRKNDESVSWKYHADSSDSWFKVAYAIKEWTEKQNRDTDMYSGLVQYTLLFAAFFDGKMEYQGHKKSLRAVRKVLKTYRQDPLGEKCFTELSARNSRLMELKHPLWRIMIRGFSLGMKHQCYMLMALGIKLLIELRIDERLSDTGLRE